MQQYGILHFPFCGPVIGSSFAPSFSFHQGQNSFENIFALEE
jgi:hypothetical protein